MEFPHLQKYYDQFKDKGLRIVSVNVGRRDTPEAIKKFWEDQKLTFLAVKNEMGDKDVMAAYKGKGCPTNYLVGKDGKIVARWVGFHPQKGPDHLKEEFAKVGFKLEEKAGEAKPEEK